MKPIFTCMLLWLLSIPLSAQETGIFAFREDIGTPGSPGKSVYDQSKQRYSLTAGSSAATGRDACHFLFNRLEGDFILTAGFSLPEAGKDPHLKTGWMVRTSTGTGSACCSVTLYGDGRTAMQWRPANENRMNEEENKVRSTAPANEIQTTPVNEIRAPKPYYQILQLERAGSTFIVRAAHRGEPLQVIGTQTLPDLSGKVLAGLYTSSGGEHAPEAIPDGNTQEAIKAGNVRIDRKVPGMESGYRLETLDVFTGDRLVIYEQDSRFEAPNWMPGGKHLLFNRDGLLWTIPAGGGIPEKLNTGPVTRNNNDHVISFDGKMIGMSSHLESPSGNGSAVYVMPLEGGGPRLVTGQTPSYLHGWTADNKEVLYVARRGESDRYNIYRKPVGGGAETVLTETGPLEHVDGCEASPDGKYIYYNGSNSGTMQIWRMRPDGSQKEQLTFDEYNNWFPHISPDGKWMVFLSYPPDIPFNAHPPRQRVMLRLMPAAGGAPKVIACMIGGQGTINVHSWSPDSKQIAFVSETGYSLLE